MVTAKEPSEAELVPLWCPSMMVNAMAEVARSPEIRTVGETPFWGFEAAAIYGLWGEINHLLTMALVHNINDLFT
ncbi:hypothetical protein [Rhizobium rhizogenes]|uniref:hypothetical protein n=1 Tax=Rhizobium rhizogenes TaxID=359 RepID=UPI0005A2404D|nr:hypothetical protein [Rhizobium rhizogenes]NTH15578.1 hypothetical protein [Rhizobium rhizogenes]NTI44995.1 hypothetical protein [Rhizobium rhizogenes]NTI77332.1 hypothetical protein [Rhizobium rhizogenes]OCJ10756.1 hypothetical protein A6U88_20835 [Agrobacterium sp. B131/95]